MKVLLFTLVLCSLTALAQAPKKAPQGHDKEHQHVDATKKDHEHADAHHKPHDHKAHHPDHKETEEKKQ